MEKNLPGNISTEELRLLIDLSTLTRAFLLNEAFETFNPNKLSKYGFYTLFFGLQTTGLVCVENLPPHMANGNTNITYKLTPWGIDTVELYKQLHPAFFGADKK